MAKKKENVQIVTGDSFKIPIDLLSRTAMNCQIPGKTDEWSDDKENVVVDKMLESKRRNVYSDITIINRSAKFVTFTEFDYAVLDACISEKMKGNEYTTATIIFHRLGGGHVLTPKMRKAILDSIERLSVVRIEVEAIEACKKNIIKSNGRSKFTGYLLPTEYLTTSINGQPVDAIHFLSNGIILSNANIRNQFVTCEQALLNPPVRATPTTIAINHFLVRRTKEIVGSNDKSRKSRTRPLRNSITLNDLYDKIGLTNGTKRQKQHARETAFKILDFFVAENVIKGWKLEKSEHGKSHAIKIEY
jgi:hypothetical protein